MDSSTAATLECLRQVHAHAEGVLSAPSPPALPLPSAVRTAASSLLTHLPDHGLGLARTAHHLLHDVAPGLSHSSLSPTYFGFVTGGLTPAARLADNVVTLYDQNVMVHLPEQSVATVVEDRALAMLLELLRLGPDDWIGRMLTTGATAGNVLGLACGREWAVRSASAEAGKGVAELGLLEACRRAGVEEVKVLSTMPHSSLAKAASVVGLGRAALLEVSSGSGLAFDMEKLERELNVQARRCIVVVSCGEINTGGYATYTEREVRQVRELCDKYGAWLHVDGAFGIFARVLDDLDPEFGRVVSGAKCLEMADSIAGDCHKMLNVPYDCGFFFTRHSMQQEVFTNGSAAYLKGGAAGGIPSPLNIGLENSRRFRALPAYATLMAYGRDGYRDMLERQVRFARAVAKYIDEHDAFELLPQALQGSRNMEDVFIVVLFRAKNAPLNQSLMQVINSVGKIFVSGTLWDGRPASRIAVSNWQVNLNRDLEVVKAVLEQVLDGSSEPARGVNGAR